MKFSLQTHMIYKRIFSPLLVWVILVPLYSSAQDSISGLQKKKNALHFIVVGDWGVRGTQAQQRVADAMGTAGAELKISFVISTGDNFYPGGVLNAADSQFIYSFENVYRAPSLQVRWYPVLGNHDYILNPDAQVDYTKHSSRWYMPSRHYDTSFAIENDSVLFVFLDTDPIDRELRRLSYDSIKYPEDGVTKQLKWLEQVLSSSHAKWKIVTGHHPVHTGGTNRHNKRTRNMRNLLQPVFARHHVDMYLCGHEHHLEYLKPKKKPTHYIISGAGSSNGHMGYLKRYRRFAAKRLGFVVMSVTPR